MHIKSVKLKDIKNFQKAELDFTRPDGSLKGWNVIVGGNASGKSTILKAMALALCGPDSGRQLMKDTSGWIRGRQKMGRAILAIEWDNEFDHFKKGGRIPKDRGCECGVRWTSGAPPRPSFKASGGDRVAQRGPWNDSAQGWFAAGYGPMRRLTGSSPDAMRDAAGGGKIANFVSLFREDAALSESEVWLKEHQFKALEGNEKAKKLVEEVTNFLNDGLLPAGFTIERITSAHVYVKANNNVKLPMSGLSDGYRNIYALVLDIIYHMMDIYGTQEIFTHDKKGQWVLTTPGVILIDEIESHLHPSWQRSICDWFKTRFPYIQFFVTTHSPLIVQAADPGGIIALPLPDEPREVRKLNDREYKRIVLGKAEKVLLGEAFGLSQTRGQWALSQINKYRKLDAKKRAGALLEDEKKEYDKLQQDMFIANEDEADKGKL